MLQQLLKIFFKPSCVTCKKTISEIERMKIDLEKRDFFKDRLSEEEIKKIIKLSGLKPQEILRKKDKMYKQLDLDDTALTDSQTIKLLVKYPGLIKRPIIIKGDKALVGKINLKDI